MNFLTYFLIIYGIIFTISACVFAYAVKHAHKVDPNAYFLNGDATLETLDNKTK